MAHLTNPDKGAGDGGGATCFCSQDLLSRATGVRHFKTGDEATRSALLLPRARHRSLSDPTKVDRWEAPPLRLRAPSRRSLSA